MKGTLVDSNVLIDVLSQDANWAAWSGEALAQFASEGPLVINGVIYAEVSQRYSRKELLDHELPEDVFIREHLPWSAAFLAGKAYLGYRRRGASAARRCRTSSSAPTPRSRTFAS